MQDSVMPNRIVVLLASILLASACAPTVDLVRYHPPEVNLAPARTLAFSVDAAPPPGGTVFLGIVDLLLGNYDRVDPSVPVAPLRDAVSARLDQDGRFSPPAPGDTAEAQVRVQVTQWWESETTVGDDDSAAPLFSGRLEVKVTLLQPGAAPIVRELSDSETVSLDDPMIGGSAPAFVLQQATGKVADQIAELILPSRYKEEVELDDSDDAVKPAVDLVKDGKLDQARAALNALLVDDPYGAATHYDLGVISELRGELAEADTRYQRAQALQPNDLHAQALERIHRAEEEARALQPLAASQSQSPSQSPSPSPSQAQAPKQLQAIPTTPAPTSPPPPPPSALLAPAPQATPNLGTTAPVAAPAGSAAPADPLVENPTAQP
jgi:hypothetical protein